MLEPEEYQALTDGHFQLQCLDMVLEQQAASIRFSGPGSITRSPDGALAFVLFAPGQLPALERTLALPRLGEMLPEEAYFRLRATDLRGRQWAASTADVGG